MIAVARFGRGSGPQTLFIFLFATEEGVTHFFVTGILMECEEYRCCCRNVDANVIRVLPRDVAQAVMVPTTLVLRSLVRDVGKELPRVEPVVCMSFRANQPSAYISRNLPSMRVPGIASVTTIVRTCSS